MDSSLIGKVVITRLKELIKQVTITWTNKCAPRGPRISFMGVGVLLRAYS